MANMSYCRFENTSNDLRDCVDAIDEAFENDGVGVRKFMAKLSASERMGMARIHKLCKRFIDLYEEGTEDDRIGHATEALDFLNHRGED